MNIGIGEGKIRDNAHAAEERRAVRGVDTRGCAPANRGVETWERRGRRAAKFSSLKPVPH